MARHLLSRVRRPRTSDVVLALCAIGFLSSVLLWQYGQFVEGAFGYHDLTIINDFFSNALTHARPFWVTNAAQTHLKTHFTPSLILLVPAFALFHSQFALIAVVAFTVCAGIFVASRDQLAALERAGVSKLWGYVLCLSFFAAFALNRYTLRTLASAHFEPVFILTASLLLAAVSRGLGYRWLLPVLFLALGVRQDAGFFMFFMLLSCLVAPRVWGDVKPSRVLVAAGLCIAYVAFASKVIMPWLGNDGHTRFWMRWGDTWPKVFLAWAREPARVYEAVQLSEFGPLNAELSYVQTLNPIAWLANQLPAILFYTADSQDKQHLWFYNAAFVLPGLMLCLGFAQLHLVTLIQRFVRHPRWRTFSLGLVSALFAYVAASAALRTPRDSAERLSVSRLERHDPFVKKPVRELLACKNVRAVSADFKAIVFVPLRFDKYLHENATKADVVVIERHPANRLPFSIKPKKLVSDLKRDGRYALATSVGGYDAYLASHVDCPR